MNLKLDQLSKNQSTKWQEALFSHAKLPTVSALTWDSPGVANELLNKIYSKGSVYSDEYFLGIKN